MKRFVMGELKKIQLLENISPPSFSRTPKTHSLSLSFPTSPLNPIKLTSQGYNANGVPKGRKQKTDDDDD